MSGEARSEGIWTSTTVRLFISPARYFTYLRLCNIAIAEVGRHRTRRTRRESTATHVKDTCMSTLNRYMYVMPIHASRLEGRGLCM